MNKTKLNNFDWTLITIVDPYCLPGKSIFNIMEIINYAIKFNFVILDDIHGAVISNLKSIENKVIEMDEFLKIVVLVKQFDWGNFFLFKNYPEKWKNTPQMSYPELIIQTDTTVRAIDDGYIYIYTPNICIINTIKANYEIETFKSNSLEKLDYPE